MEQRCAICGKAGLRDDAPILAVGATGVERCLCDSCAALIETATDGVEYGEIASAMDSLSKVMTAYGAEDPVAVKAVASLMSDAAERASKIKDGTYDFSSEADKEDVEIIEELPEELLETEEDRELDRRDAEALKRFDRIMNWVTPIAIGAAILGIIIYFLAR